MNRTIKVEAFSRNGRRIIATVVNHMKSSKYTFAMVEAGDASLADIAIVDDGDPEMRQPMADLLARSPSVKVIYLVAAASANPGRRHELMGIHLVSHLMPMMEVVARTIGATELAGQPATLAPQNNKIVQLVPKQRPEKLRALVVDDSPTVRMQLVKIIERMGLDCEAAAGGEAALQKLARQTYHMIFVDVVMPDMDGYRLTREIKRNPDHKSTPVVILTSKSSPFDRARGALAGCDTYLTKPVELKRLFEATSQCLRKSMAVSDLSDWVLDPLAPVVQPMASSPSDTSRHRSAAPVNSLAKSSFH